MKSYTHYIFDLDRTLLSLDVDWSTWHETMVDICAKRGIKYEFVSTVTMNQQLNEFIRLGGPEERNNINTLLHDAEFHSYRGYTPVPVTIDFLQKLPPEIPKYIWTANTFDTATKALTESDLAQYFQTIASRDNVMYSKPDPAGFTEAIYDSKTALSQYVLIGDSENDQVAAHAAGIDFVHIKDLPQT